ncbi:hypothetical protein CPB83DRAFT_790698 [Crepidotus variabilis]|uniref:DUF1996 domain-containing protein n=1 Tax=Crepidotus variabilis TaxID=179855 RepID=A0A9P6EHG8_9AGAR|nr:hypothetical protein CPB83DRAFT_790698 [Crepidotus variabilis]
MVQLLLAFVVLPFVQAYWLMGANNVLTTQRIDPIMNPGIVSNHVHAVVGGSNFGLNFSTASLRSSECSSIPISEDKSNYWYPQLYFQWDNGSFTSVAGNPVMYDLFLESKLESSNALNTGDYRYYLFSDKAGTTTAFPDDFRMISGNPVLRTFDSTSFAQQAVTYICLDFNGKPTRSNQFPKARCPSGVRSQINFPSCWDGKNSDSADHQSHMSFMSTGPDTGNCSNPAYPVTVPRIFLEVYWYTQAFDNFRNQAKVPDQPFVFSNGDPIGYSFHADFANGWQAGALQGALDKCNCNPYGDPSCCAAQGVFTLDQKKQCVISDTVDEVVFGTLGSLPGNNPVRTDCGIEYADTVVPALLSPVYVSNSTEVPMKRGTISVPAMTLTGPSSTSNTREKEFCKPESTLKSSSACCSRSSVLSGWWLITSIVGLVIGWNFDSL